MSACWHAVGIWVCFPASGEQTLAAFREHSTLWCCPSCWLSWDPRHQPASPPLTLAHVSVLSRPCYFNYSSIRVYFHILQTGLSLFPPQKVGLFPHWSGFKKQIEVLPFPFTKQTKNGCNFIVIPLTLQNLGGTNFLQNKMLRMSARWPTGCSRSLSLKSKSTSTQGQPRTRLCGPWGRGLMPRDLAGVLPTYVSGERQTDLGPGVDPTAELARKKRKDSNS